MDNRFAPSPGRAGWSAWSPLDEYLWHSCEILADLVEGRLNQRPLVATTARLEPGERALAVGPAQRMTWRPVGNGRYTHKSLFAFGGPAFVIGSMAASALGNSSRRRTAARDAQPRWVPEGAGELTVTARRAYFSHQACGLDLAWNGLDSIDLVAPDAFETSFRSVSSGRQLTVRLHTPWASLIFVLAALSGFPAHPRLLSRSWLPPDFEERAARVGRPCRPAAQLVIEGRSR